MARYKKVKRSEYQLYRGDLLVWYLEKNNEIAKLFSGKIATGTPKSVIVFNLKSNDREELEKWIKNGEIEKDKLYLDNNENITINYIEKECYKLKSDDIDFIVIIDYEKGNIGSDKEVSNRLKELACALDIHIFVIANLIENRNSNPVPTIEDVEHKELIEYADTVLIEYKASGKAKKDKTILAKNNYGKTGILKKLGGINHE